MSKEVLIVKILGIGDVVMSFSIIEWIRRNEPGTKLTWVVGKNSAELLTPFTDFITPIVVNEKELFGKSLLSRGMELLRIWKILFLKKFDLILTLHSDSRFRLISLFCLASEKRFFTRKGRINPNPSRHYSNEYLNLYLKLDSSESQSGSLPRFNLWGKSSKLRKLFQENSTYVCLNVSGARNALSDAPLKRWPIENYLSLAEKLIHKGINIVLIGSVSDIKDAELFNNLPNLINLVGKTTVLECVEVISYSNALISHDTGNLHLGSLTSTPIIALFGPTNPNNFSPIRSDITTLWGGENLACRPCYDGRTFAQCSNNKCLKTIQPEEVLNQLNLILSQKADDHTP